MQTATAQASATTSPSSKNSERLESLDVLRGWDMFWIMGGDVLVRSLQKIDDNSVTRTLAEQMEHVPFAGFHFYDLIFPLFVFMVGIAIAFSIPSMVERNGRTSAVKRIFIRSIALFLLGVIYMGGVKNGFKNIYFVGVLHRIAEAYFFAALIYCFCRNVRALIAICIGCLVGYWALMTFVPVPSLVPLGNDPAGFLPHFQMDFSHLNPPSYEEKKSLAYAIDQSFMPGQKFEGTILSTFAAVANALLGVLAGIWIKQSDLPDKKKVLGLVGGGAFLLFAGILWSFQFPIIKVLWTSSFVLVTCGIGAVLLGIFYQIIDVWKFRTWAQPFVWIGMNAITIYLVSAFVNFRSLAERLVGGEVGKALGSWSEFVKSVVVLVMVFAFVRFLYRRKIFLRL